MKIDRTKFKGIFTALLTPFDNDGKINKQSLKKLIDFNLKCGINGFYVGGSTGEGVILNIDTRAELFRTVKEIVGDRATLIAHVGTTSTEESEKLSIVAKENNYDAISSVAPFYYAHSFEAIKTFYRDISKASGLPVIIYNFPQSCGFTLTKDALADMITEGHILGVKHTTSDFFALQQFKTLKENPVVFNGYDEMLSAGLIMGADGGIGSTYNLMPHKIVKLYNLFKEGKIAEVMSLQKEINEIIKAMLDLSGRSGLMNVEKAVLTGMGIEMGQSKKPFLPLKAEELEKIKPISEKLLAEVREML